ncbi:MAG: hypothetical protein GX196_09585 [Clostridiaceae bacterium]|nr:hypothetical protein [Clostridiaceae bacterium]
MYTSDMVFRDIKKLEKKGARVKIIGKSVMGKNIYSIVTGTGNPVLFVGTHHGLEWITALFLIKAAKYFLKHPPGAEFHIIPMLNPDGADIAQNKVSKSSKYYESLVKMNNGNPDFSKTWQANARGVDLNHNYDAYFYISKMVAKDLGYTSPGPTRYGGESPESEPESRALVEYTKSHDFKLVVAYHSQGEVIYWDFLGKCPPKGLEWAKELSQACGYALDVPEGVASFSGFKDYCIHKLNIPAYTVEVGLGENPLPWWKVFGIYKKNIPFMEKCAQLVFAIDNKN